MRKFSSLPVLLFCFSLTCFSFDGFAQQAGVPEKLPADARSEGRSAVGRRISLDVVVTDKRGTIVSGLQEQDFTILDDKRPQTIVSFHAADGSKLAGGGAGNPAKDANGGVDGDLQQIILVVDAVNTGFNTTSHGRQELENFLRKDGGKLFLPTSLVLLDDTSTRMQPKPTRDGNALADNLRAEEQGLRTIGRSTGFYGAVERVQISLRALEGLASYEAPQPGRKLLIWLSTGWPLLSGQRISLSGKDQTALFNSIVKLSTELREDRVTVYSIDPLGAADAGSFRTFFYESFLKGVKSANQVQTGNLGLQVLAVQSGGRVLSSSNDIVGSIANCVEDGKAFYTLSFDSAPADSPNEYHNLQVKIDKPGFTARTRTGYYAQP
jgi:VWFA-related protein